MNFAAVAQRLLRQPRARSWDRPHLIADNSISRPLQVKELLVEDNAIPQNLSYFVAQHRPPPCRTILPGPRDSSRNARVQALQDRWDRMRQIITDRAHSAEFANVPGGHQARGPGCAGRTH